jgi:hypothetical protein
MFGATLNTLSMKTHSFSKHLQFFVIIFAAVFSTFNLNGQTSLSGTSANNCAPPAGGILNTTGTFVGCGAGAGNPSGVNNTFLGKSAGLGATGNSNNNTYVGYLSVYVVRLS